MTNLEIIELAFIWILLGCLICFKRNWYSHIPKTSNGTTRADYIGATITLSPIALIIAIFNEFILRDWNNKIE